MDTIPNPPEFVPPPPAPPPPPPVITPASAPQPHRGTGWMITAIIVILLLLASVFINLTQFIASALHLHRGLSTEAFSSDRDIGPKLDEYMLENNHNQYNKIAVITVDGIITSHE